MKTSAYLARAGVVGLSIGLSLLPSFAGTDRPAPLGDDDFHPVAPGWADLGQLLFFDPMLSGNQNIACSTCHHPSLGTSDAMSLSMGEGGVGLGPARVAEAGNQPHGRIPRNAPALFNLGAKEFAVMFHDGRVEADDTAAYGVAMPEGRALERPFPNVLSAQNVLPLLSGDEMAGQAGENDIADAVANDHIRGPEGAWALISDRVEAVPAYQRRFQELTGSDEVHIADIATALSSFINVEFRATDSIFDHWLAGEISMPAAAERGADLFYGKANCASCHSGALLTDNKFYAIAMPQFGPGKETSYARDTGRFAVTGDPDDMYKFRTPSLRNIGLTAPYGHNGAFAALEDIVRHHLDPVASLMAYTGNQAALHGDIGDRSQDMQVLANMQERQAIAAANELAPVKLSDAEVNDLIEFLRCLTDPASEVGRMGEPATVPSGLSLDPV